MSFYADEGIRVPVVLGSEFVQVKIENSYRGT